MKAKQLKRISIIVVLIAIVAGGIWKWQHDRDSALPEGIASGNGRLEADQVDVAVKYAGRVAEILVNEGDMVGVDQVVARMDMTELQAQLERAKASVAEAEAAISEYEAMIA
ncbi:MAG: hypothetical protein B6D36_04940, partial [Planctomycetes bacterium UTPLA1]